MSGGLNVIRDALASRNIAILSRDVGASTAALDSFARGDIETLPIDIVHALTSEIWHGFMIYDAQTDVLHPKKQPPAKSIGAPPQLTMTLPVFKRGPPPRGPQPEVPAAPKPKKRAGWA